MKVPVYERQTSRVTPSVSTPRELSPPVAAFGTEMAEATQRLGETGQKIAGHFEKMAQDEQDVEVLQRLNSYKQDMQNRLVDEGIEIVKIGGQDVERPKGFLSRQLKQAKGATQEFDQLYLKNIRKQYLNGLSQYQIDKLGPALDSYAVSLRDNIISHEATQHREYIKNEVESDKKQRFLDASTIRDGKSLSLMVDEAIEAAKPYNRWFDEKTRKIKDDEIAVGIVKSAVLSTQNTIGLLPAQKLLYDVKDKIPQAKFEEIGEQIQIDAEQATKRARFQAMIAKNELESALVDEYFARTLTTDKIKRLHSEVSPSGERKISDGFATAMVKNLESMKKIDAKPNSSTFNKLVDYILADNKPEEIRNELLKENAKGEITDDELKTLNTFNQNITKEVINNKLPRTPWRDFLNVINFWGDNYASFRPEIKVQMFKEYMQRTQKGENPQEAVDVIIRGQIQRDITEVTTKSTTKNARIQDKIKELKKTMSDDKIREALREKGINPEVYDF